MNEQSQKPRLSLTKMNVDDPVRKPKAVLSTPSSPTTPKKSSNGKYNCLCSPTTHVGSFRCRYHRNGQHRNAGLTRNSISVGAKLSDLASISELATGRSSFSDLDRKPGGIHDQLHFQ